MAPPLGATATAIGAMNPIDPKIECYPLAGYWSLLLLLQHVLVRLLLVRPPSSLGPLTIGHLTNDLGHSSNLLATTQCSWIPIAQGYCSGGGLWQELVLLVHISRSF